MRQLLPLILFFASALGCAARTAADFLLSAPFGVIPSLSERARLEMLEYYKANSDMGVKNIFGGNSRVVLNTPGSVAMDISERTQIAVALVPMRRDTLLAVVETVLTPVADSRVTFYGKDWRKLERQPGNLTVSDFVDNNDMKANPDAEWPAFAFYTLTYSADDDAFIAANTTPKYYADMDRPSGLKLMQPAIKVRFDGKKWQKLNLK